jgi:RND family efflux transporter MFP subunit
VILLAACGRTPGGDAETDPVTVLAPADVATARMDTVATGPRISGTLEPAKKAVMRAEAGGSVLEVAVELGDKVTTGQLLGRIETSGSGDLWRSAQSSVLSAEQDLKNADRDLERARRLADAGAVSPRDVEVSESQRASAAARLEASRAQLASAGTQLGRTTLKSPIDGVVAERAVNVGDVVTPGAPMFTVIEPSSLRLEASVPAASIGALSVGTAVRFEVQGYPDRPIEGTIDRIAPAVDATTRQIPVLVSIPNDGTNALVAGLFADGRIANDQHEGLVVPADAVDLGGAVPAVLTVVEGRVERVDVAIGLKDEGAEQIEVTSGLRAGAIVIRGGAHDVAPGTRVEVRVEGTAGPSKAADARTSGEG